MPGANKKGAVIHDQTQDIKLVSIILTLNVNILSPHTNNILLKNAQKITHSDVLEIKLTVASFFGKVILIH